MPTEASETPTETSETPTILNVIESVESAQEVEISEQVETVEGTAGLISSTEMGTDSPTQAKELTKIQDEPTLEIENSEEVKTHEESLQHEKEALTTKVKKSRNWIGPKILPKTMTKIKDKSQVTYSPSYLGMAHQPAIPNYGIGRSNY